MGSPVAFGAELISAQRSTTGLLPVTAATFAGNALSYLLLAAAARVLHPGDYSEVVTLLNLLLVGSVAMLALQVVAARRCTTGDASGVLRLAGLVGGTATALVLAMAIGIVDFLHLPGGLGVLLVAASLTFLALQGAAQGLLQGLMQFRPLAGVTFLGLLGRSAGGLIGLVLSRTAVSTLVGLGIGIAASSLVTVLVCPPVRGWHRQGWPQLRTMLAEVTHAVHAYGLFLLLTSADVLLARHVLPATAAGAYAAGSVLTRIAVWLPQSLAIVLFPSLTDMARHRRLVLRAVAALIGLAVAMAGGSWVLRGWVWAVVAGSHYSGTAGLAWLFVLLGGALALTQFALVAGLAVRSTALTAVLWCTVAVEVAAVLVLRSPGVLAVVGTACLVNVAGAAVAVVVRLGGARTIADSAPERR